MQKTILLRLLALLLFTTLVDVANAQWGPREDDTYGPGGKKTFSPQGVRPRSDTIYDKNGTKREVTVHDVVIPDFHLTGQEKKYYDCEGKLVHRTMISRGMADIFDPTVTDDNYSESYDYDKDGMITKGERKRVTPEGERIYERFDPARDENGNVKGWRRIPPPDRRYPSMRPPLPTTPDKCDRRTGCIPKTDLRVAYSILNESQDGESETLPLGLHVAVAHLISERIAITAGVSVHTKKVDEYKFMRAFLMGGVEYNLIKTEQARALLMVRLLAGLAMDRQKFGSETYSESGFAAALGLGFQYELTKRMAIAVLADYIRTRLNEQTINNIRLGAGISFRLGCK